MGFAKKMSSDLKKDDSLSSRDRFRMTVNNNNLLYSYGGIGGISGIDTKRTQSKSLIGDNKSQSKFSKSVGSSPLRRSYYDGNIYTNIGTTNINNNNNNNEKNEIPQLERTISEKMIKWNDNIEEKYQQERQRSRHSIS